MHDFEVRLNTKVSVKVKNILIIVPVVINIVIILNLYLFVICFRFTVTQLDQIISCFELHPRVRVLTKHIWAKIINIAAECNVLRKQNWIRIWNWYISFAVLSGIWFCTYNQFYPHRSIFKKKRKEKKKKTGHTD